MATPRRGGCTGNGQGQGRVSDTDSFIEEVTEEVRRDRLYRALRKYGWIGVVVVLAIVGGAAWNEYSKAQDRARAEALGDSILGAIAPDAPQDRIAALSDVQPETPGGRALVAMLTAAEQGVADRRDEAAETLGRVAGDGEVPDIYRDIASFKRLLQMGDSLPAEERRTAFEVLARPGNPLRLLAEEQLALIEVEAGDTRAAIARLQAILEDSEVTSGLRQRVSQAIVALGGELDAA